jgi:hypothetical protein
MAKADKPQPDGAQGPTQPSGATTAASTDTTKPDDTPAPVLPARIKLIYPYGFLDDDGTKHFWCPGYETDKPDEIAVFVARGVEFEVLG